MAEPVSSAVTCGRMDSVYAGSEAGRHRTVRRVRWKRGFTTTLESRDLVADTGPVAATDRRSLDLQK